MKTNQFTTIVIEAEENMYLTQANDVDIKDRIVASRIALGKFDNPDYYKEISKAEGDAIKAEQENLIEAEINERDKE